MPVAAARKCPAPAARPARCRGCTAKYVGHVTWKAGPVNTRCLVIWCRRCTTVPSAAQCTPMRMRGPLHGGQGRITRRQGTCRFCARRPAHSWAGRRRDRRRHTRARGAHRAARRAAPAAPRAADLAGATHMPTLKTMGRRLHHPAHHPHPRSHILNLHALPPECQGAVRGLGFAAGGQAQHLARPVQLHHLLKEGRNGGASHEGGRCTAGGQRAPLLRPSHIRPFRPCCTSSWRAAGRSIAGCDPGHTGRSSPVPAPRPLIQRCTGAQNRVPTRPAWHCGMVPSPPSCVHACAARYRKLRAHLVLHLHAEQHRVLHVLECHVESVALCRRRPSAGPTRAAAGGVRGQPGMQLAWRAWRLPTCRAVAAAGAPAQLCNQQSSITGLRSGLGAVRQRRTRVDFVAVVAPDQLPDERVVHLLHLFKLAWSGCRDGRRVLH